MGMAINETDTNVWDRLEVIAWFKNLGITLQTNRTSFTWHIRDIVTVAVRAIHDISHE
jgi:hypothetical protein